jgi:FKBP-type peptidyl-prolyl isomerase-like protein/CpeT/CpcT family protein DUF1001
MFKVSFPCVLSAAMFVGFAGGIAQAQDDAAPAAPVYVAPPAYTPSWSDDGIAKIASQLTGTWNSGSGDEALAMSIAPAPVVGMSDTLFVESVRADAPWEPYRMAFFQLYRYKGDIRLRTYELAMGDSAKGVFSGMWAATDLFPEILSESLIATLDVELETTSTGFTGATPYPYPTGIAGAVEMTSSVTLDGDTLSVADRGFDASGKIVWGSEADAVIAFERSDPYAQVTRRDDGMVIIDFGGDNGIVPTQGDQLHVHYNGYTADGNRFDSSYARNQPFAFAYPPGTRAITGWGIGMEGFAMGNHRKLVIPGYLAYGERGNPRANIPTNATLYFDIYMALIEHAEGDAAPQPVQPAPVDSHEGHNHD